LIIFQPQGLDKHTKSVKVVITRVISPFRHRAGGDYTSNGKSGIFSKEEMVRKVKEFSGTRGIVIPPI
jgi:hypothetical protein